MYFAKVYFAMVYFAAVYFAAVSLPVVSHSHALRCLAASSKRENSHYVPPPSCSKGGVSKGTGLYNGFTPPLHRLYTRLYRLCGLYRLYRGQFRLNGLFTSGLVMLNTAVDSEQTGRLTWPFGWKEFWA